VHKAKIKDVHELRERIVDEWDKLDRASSTKPLESGERDFELVWLQEVDSFKIRCEHFLLGLLAFCRDICVTFEG